MPIDASSVATIRSEQPAITALPAKQRPLTTAIRGTRPDSAGPERERARVERRDRPGSRCRPGGRRRPRRRRPSGSRIRSISSNSRSFLRWPERALRAGQHRVVVGRAPRTGAPSIRAVPATRPSAGVRAISSSSVAALRAAPRSRTARTRRTSPGRPGRRRSRAPCARRARGAAPPRRAGPRPRSARGGGSSSARSSRSDTRGSLSTEHERAFRGGLALQLEGALDGIGGNAAGHRADALGYDDLARGRARPGAARRC